MDLFSPALWLLAVLAVGSWAIGLPAQRALRAAERDLSEEDLNTFRHSYRRRADRADMPSRFKPLAHASDRHARIYLISAGLVIVSLVWIVMAGPNLGLLPA